MKDPIQKIVQIKSEQDKTIDKKMLSAILQQITNMKKSDLTVISQVLEAQQKLEDTEFRYIGRHALENAAGKTVRVPRMEFAWTKRSMIQLGRAIQNVNAFMYNFGNLPTTKQENLTKITARFLEIEEGAKEIAKLASFSRPKPKTKAPKTIKEAKAQSIETANKSQEEPEETIENQPETATEES